MKLVLIDGERAVIGSHNWSVVSLTENLEVSVVVEDPVKVGRLRAWYAALWERGREV